MKHKWEKIIIPKINEQLKGSWLWRAGVLLHRDEEELIHFISGQFLNEHNEIVQRKTRFPHRGSGLSCSQRTNSWTIQRILDSFLHIFVCQSFDITYIFFRKNNKKCSFIIFWMDWNEVLYRRSGWTLMSLMILWLFILLHREVKHFNLSDTRIFGS